MRADKPLGHAKAKAIVQQLFVFAIGKSHWGLQMVRATWACNEQKQLGLAKGTSHWGLQVVRATWACNRQ